jgi:hypothetical protein
MKTASFLMIVLLMACASRSTDQSMVSLSGVVVTADGMPVQNAIVVLYEELSRRPTMFPKSDRKIAEVRTDRMGKFNLTFNDAAPMARLKLVAESKKRRVKVDAFTTRVEFDNGVVRSPSKEAINKIVVPSSYVAR